MKKRATTKDIRPGKTNSVVMAGMGTAVAVVLSMLGLYMPVFSTLIFLTIPLPIIYIALKEGSRWALIVTIGTLILDSVFFGIMSGAFLCAIFGVLGVTLGICYERNVRPAVTLIAGAAAVLIAFAGQMLFGIYVLGVGDVFMSAEFFDAMKANTLEILPQFYSGDALTAMQAQIDIMFDSLKKSVYFAIAAAGLVYSWAAMTLSQMLFRRMGIKDIPTLPPVSRWEFPVVTVYVYLVSVGIGMLITDDETLNLILYNFGLACNFIFWLQGLAFLWWLPNRFPAVSPLRWVIVALAFFIPLVQTVMIVAGLFDMLMHYRMKRNYEYKRDE